MNSSRSLTPLSQDDYVSIEAAVMETARGRWFLAEYARRNRTADTQILLDAIERLEQAVVGERAVEAMERVRFDLMEMAKAIARTKAEIAAIRPNGQVQSRFEEASEALDSVTRTTERATSEILEAAEQIQETAWTLREQGADDELCDALDKRATEIYASCSFQDITAQRTSKVVQVLRYLEGRINAMIDIWSQPSGSPVHDEAKAEPDYKPDVIDNGLSQSDIDMVIVDEEHLFTAAHDDFSTPDHQAALDAHALHAAYATDELKPAMADNVAEPEAIAPDAAEFAAPVAADQFAADSFQSDPRRAAFATIDALGTYEKLRRFT